MLRGAAAQPGLGTRAGSCTSWPCGRVVARCPLARAVYRALHARRADRSAGQAPRGIDACKRWERGGAMELWQMDVVGGVLLADGTQAAKVLTGIDDHSRFCRLRRRDAPGRPAGPVCARVRRRAGAPTGVPQQILTDNGKVFTGRFGPPRDRGLVRPDLPRERDRSPAHRAPQSPTTTGKIERLPPDAALGVPHRTNVRRSAPAPRPSAR